MGLKERKERDKEQLRQAILTAAEEMFVKEGFENVSMRKIARKIEYSPTTIYLYFKDKEELFCCLLEEYFAKLKRIMNQNKNLEDDIETSLKKGMVDYIKFGVENPNYYKLAFLANPNFKAEYYLIEGLIGTEVFLNLKNMVTEAIRRKIFKDLDVDLVTQIIWTMNHGITSLLITNPNFPWVDKEELIQQTVEATFKGFTIS